MWQRYGKLLILPAAAILGVTVGAVGGALAFDHFASVYLWPEPEDIIVQHASYDTPAPQVTVSENEPMP